MVVLINTNKEELGIFLKSVRKEAGFNLSQLSRASNISQPYLTQIEAGERTPTPEVLKKLADGLCYVTGEYYSYGTLLEKAGYEELAKGQMLLEFFGARIEIPATETVSPGDPYMTSVEKDILERLGKSIPADNVEQVLTDNQSTVEQHVTADNLYDLKRVFKQISKPVTFGDDTLTVKEKAMLYDFVEIMLKHRED